MRRLAELAALHDTDKCERGHGYVDVYARYLDPVRDDVRTVLEIGVYKGDSIRMWRDYFPRAVVYGADHNLALATPTGERTELLHVEQDQPESLRQLASRGPFDVVVDDGSHQPRHQIRTFEALFPALRPGGIYFCEDLQGQFWGDGSDGVYSRESFDYFARLAFHLQADGAGRTALFAEELAAQLDFWQRAVEFVHFYRYIVAIGRRR